jgi:sporulation protein YlmC with PRC-barrel domain
MAHVLLSDTKDWALADKDQDLRGWDVLDANGTRIGTVGDLIVDTDAQRVDTIVLEDGTTFRADAVSLGDHVVYVEAYGAPVTARPYHEGRGVHRPSEGAVAGSAAIPPAPVPNAASPPSAAAPAPAASTGAYTDYEREFHDHYRATYGDRRLDYTDYAPAYRFGYDMAYDDRYAALGFDGAEGQLREAYYRRHGYPMSDNLVWNSIRDAVRHAYEHARGRR